MKRTCWKPTPPSKLSSPPAPFDVSHNPRASSPRHRHAHRRLDSPYQEMSTFWSREAADGRLFFLYQTPMIHSRRHRWLPWVTCPKSSDSASSHCMMRLPDVPVTYCIALGVNRNAVTLLEVERPGPATAAKLKLLKKLRDAKPRLARTDA